MPTLLANVESSTAGTAPAAFADVPALTSGAVIVASAASRIILIANMQPDSVLALRRVAEFQFAVDGVREGPVALVYKQSTTGHTGGLSGFTYMLTGISGSHTFSLQWKTITAAPDEMTLDTGRVRNLQVIEIP
jgi:hypothetical protein